MNHPPPLLIRKPVVDEHLPDVTLWQQLVVCFYSDCFQTCSYVQLPLPWTGVTFSTLAGPTQPVS